MDLPASRRDAMSKGETTYFTGKTCIHGHVAYRYASSGACSTCVLNNASSARQSLQPPEELIPLRLRVVPVDAATLLDTAVAMTQRRHPDVSRGQILGKTGGVGIKPEGGTLLYIVNVDAADAQLIKEMGWAMLRARGPDPEAERRRIFGALAAQAEASRDNGETEWKFT